MAFSIAVIVKRNHLVVTIDLMWLAAAKIEKKANTTRWRCSARVYGIHQLDNGLQSAKALSMQQRQVSWLVTFSPPFPPFWQWTSRAKTWALLTVAGQLVNYTQFPIICVKQNLSAWWGVSKVLFHSKDTDKILNGNCIRLRVLSDALGALEMPLNKFRWRIWFMSSKTRNFLWSCERE